MTIIDPEAIAQISLDKVDTLKYRPAHPEGHNGKRRDWTCIAAIVADTTACDGLGGPGNLECVAVGIGLKCLHEQAASPATVNDSHAEVLCRRAFRCFLLAEIRKQLGGGSSSFVEPSQPGRPDPPTFAVRAGVRFHMYISQAPCGDASLEALASVSTVDENHARKRTEHKRATLLATNQIDPALTPLRGRNVFDLPCVLRTKPGRNDSIPTRSLSCSDKIARWQCLGLQGALLSVLVPDPVLLASIVVGDHFHPIGLERALVHRVFDHVLSIPLLLHTRLQFAWSQEYIKECAEPNVIVVPAPHGFTWWLGGQSEYLVNGRKQGAAAGKDGQYLRKTWSQVSKPVWFSAWSDTVLQAGWTHVPRQYVDAKNLAVEYQERKRLLLTRHPVFSCWVGNEGTQVDHFEVDVDAL